MLKYSIIVPVYNVERYVEQCLHSILQQSYQNIELIVVDDGSSDNTVKVCQKIAQEDRRVRVICNKHGGVSVARNTGLANITGDYVFFVDGDDFIERDYIEKTNEILLKSQVDILITNHYYFYDNNTGKCTDKEMFSFEKYKSEKKIPILDFILDNQYMLPGGVSFNIYKVSFLKCNKCCFMEDIRWFEDLDFFLQVMSQGPTYEVTGIKYYYYRRNRKDSTIKMVTTKNILDKMEVIRKWYEYIVENDSRANSFTKVKGWLEREYYLIFAFCIPYGEKNVDYHLLEEEIMKDEKIWIVRYPEFGKNVKRFGLQRVLPVIKIKEYGKVILKIK